jgi:phosphoglycolate phosphatase
MIRLIVFDLDGTLVDSQRDLANAANALVTELGGQPLLETTVATMVGEGAAVLVRRVLSAAQLDPATPDALPRFLELYDQRLVEHTIPYEGIVGMLEAVGDRMPLAVLTNKPQRATDRLLNALGLSRYFRLVIGGDTPHGRKPNPEGLLRICADLDVPATHTVLVGDSPVDLQTAHNAGTQVLLVSFGFGFRFAADELTAVPVVATPTEIAQYVFQI